MHDYIIGIDPGNTKSAFCLVHVPDMRPLYFEKADNEEMWRNVFHAGELVDWNVDVAVEMIASYGMPVGREVFDTCVWIGQMKDRIEGIGKECHLIFRKDEKMAICYSPKANDANIRQALVDRFAPNVPNKGKGSKKEPGWFYGFHDDIWQAYAIAVTYYEKQKGG